MLWYQKITPHEPQKGLGAGYVFLPEFLSTIVIDFGILPAVANHVGMDRIIAAIVHIEFVGVCGARQQLPLVLKGVHEFNYINNDTPSRFSTTGS